MYLFSEKIFFNWSGLRDVYAAHFLNDLTVIYENILHENIFQVIELGQKYRKFDHKYQSKEKSGRERISAWKNFLQ